MAQQLIGLGAAANDGTGDNLRAAGTKINANFTELYNAIVGMLDLKGATDCSGNPNYPAASKGDMYLVSVAGKIGGAAGKAVDVGDAVIASADNAGGNEAAVGGSWFVIEHNLAAVLLAGNNLSDLTDAAAARANLGVARKYAPGRYFLADGPTAISVAGAAPGAGSLRIYPGFVHEKVTLSSLAARVTTAAAGGHVELYIWASDPVTRQPTGAPIASSAAISTAAAGTFEDATLAVTLDPGLYWFGAICDASAATAVFASIGTANVGSQQTSGIGTLASALANITGWSVAAAYGSPPALSGNLTTDGFAAQTTASIPLVIFKAS